MPRLFLFVATVAVAAFAVSAGVFVLDSLVYAVCSCSYDNNHNNQYT